jgi:hypothetical protein
LILGRLSSLFLPSQQCRRQAGIMEIGRQIFCGRGDAVCWSKKISK